jgi:hypothetical protein
MGGGIKSPQLTQRDTTRGLPPMHHATEEIRTSSRERLHSNHPLGAKAVENAAREHTTRLLGGANTKRISGGGGGGSTKLETKMLPPSLF